MQQIAIPSAVWHEAHRDPELAKFFADEISLERAMFGSWAREAGCHEGVSWSGMGPDPWVGRTADSILNAAREKLARRKAWEASPQGRFMAAVSEIATLAREIDIEAEVVRNAQSRSWTSEIRFIDVRTQKIEALARKLVQTSLDAQVAIGAECERLETEADEAAA